MDIVITYVNGQDPVWQKEYEKTVGKKIIARRYRDWGTMPYLMRGIEKYLPQVGNVFLVVSSESQVPSWVNRDEVKVILHKDIIPQNLLPVFNSAAIEMFLHRIPGLSEQYLYMNDDLFPMNSCDISDFFVENKIVIKHSPCLTAFNLFRKHVRNSDHLARKAAGAGKGPVFMRPQHSVSPMLRSHSEAAFKAVEDDIMQNITPLRSEKNINQYFFTDYLFYKGLTIQKKQSKRHFSTAVASAEKICSFIQNPDVKIACINDVDMPEDTFRKMSSAIKDAFQHHFPKKSKYEL